MELPLSSFLVLCALYLYLVFQGHWSLLELWFSMSLGTGIHELGSELQGFGNGSLGDSFSKVSWICQELSYQGTADHLGSFEVKLQRNS